MKFTKNKKIKKIKAFTLIELIVVITILSILGTISMIAFSGYQSKARDSVRTTSIKTIETGLESLYVRISYFPFPDDNIKITDGSTDLIYQGKVGNSVTNLMDGIGDFIDPETKKYYTYAVNSKQTKYQLLGFYENEISNINLSLASEQEKTPIVYGDGIGILLTSDDLPIEEDETIQGIGTLDISELLNYNFILPDSEKFTISTNNGIGTSCKNILDNDNTKLNQDGVYTLWLKNGELAEFWCDMTTDSGGWTVIAKSGKQLEESVLGECSSEKNIDNLNSEDSNYFIYCDLDQTEVLVNQIGDYADSGDDDGYVIGTSYTEGDYDPDGQGDCTIRTTKTGVSECNRIGTSEYKALKITQKSDYGSFASTNLDDIRGILLYAVTLESLPNIYTFFNRVASGDTTTARVGLLNSLSIYYDDTGFYKIEDGVIKRKYLPNEWVVFNASPTEEELAAVKEGIFGYVGVR